MATYDRRRLERERVVATAGLAAERAALARARARLLALLGGGPASAVTGTLLPDSDPPALADLHAATLARPDLQSLALHVQASALDRRAAGRWWMPDLRLEAGWKGVSLPAGGRTDGYVIGVALALPLWNRLDGLARTAEGEARAARGERALRLSEIDGALAGARAQAVELRQAAAVLRAHVRSISDDLVHMASLGYEGGELGVLELLDAYRGAADDELNALDMEHDARRARIELDRLTGAALPGGRP